MVLHHALKQKEIGRSHKVNGEIVRGHCIANMFYIHTHKLNCITMKIKNMSLFYLFPVLSNRRCCANVLS